MPQATAEKEQFLLSSPTGYFTEEGQPKIGVTVPLRPFLVPQLFILRPPLSTYRRSCKGSRFAGDRLDLLAGFAAGVGAAAGSRLQSLGAYGAAPAER